MLPAIGALSLRHIEESTLPEKETTYYEIALSARQVLITFIVALSCISLAFFAGLWVGQQDDDQSTVAEAAAAGEDEGAPALGFFTDSAEDSVDEPDPAGDRDRSRETTAAARGPATEQSEPRRRDAAEDATPAPRGQAAPSGSIILQVLASSNRTTAEDTLASLRDAGHNAYLQPIDRGDSTLYRVRVGPFADRGAAEAAKGRIDDAFGVEALITTAE